MEERAVIVHSDAMEIDAYINMLVAYSENKIIEADN
jgi:hypothetical protein